MASLLFLLPILIVFFGAATAKCPSGTTFESNFNKCYKYFNTPRPFLAAEQTCNSIGGHLVAVQNAFENSYVDGLSGGSSFWIGANLLLSSSWTWTTNSSLYYANWAPGQPKGSNDCAYIRNSDGQWTTGACNTAFPFMCAIDPNAPLNGTCSIPTNPTCPSQGCSDDAYCTSGYTLFRGNCLCYKYFTDNKTFSVANNTCSQDGGMLAKSETPEVNSFLAALPGIDCYGVTCPGIGLHCKNSDLSSCKWVDGTPLGSYTNFWNSGYQDYPDDANEYYCLVAATNPQKYKDYGKWEGDSRSRSFICQKSSLRRSVVAPAMKWTDPLDFEENAMRHTALARN